MTENMFGAPATFLMPLSSAPPASQSNHSRLLALILSSGKLYQPIVLFCVCLLLFSIMRLWFTYIAVCNANLFIFVVQQCYSVLQMCYDVFTYSFVKHRHLGCFQYFVTMHWAATNIYVHVCLWICFQFSWVISRSRIFHCRIGLALTL